MNTVIDRITHYDTVAFSWFMRRENARLIARISRMISRMGDGPLYALIGLALFFFAGEQGKQFLLFGLAAFALELPVYWLLKNSIKRNRPFVVTGFDAFIVPSDTFSFPSGHTAAAFVMATLTAFLFPAYVVPAYAMAVAIGISRVLLGVHFFTDIMAGAILGSSCAVLMISLLG